MTMRETKMGETKMGVSEGQGDASTRPINSVMYINMNIINIMSTFLVKENN